jgi:hypothetical protein
LLSGKIGTLEIHSSYLSANRRNADSLLAAYRLTGDLALLPGRLALLHNNAAHNFQNFLEAVYYPA